MNCPPSLPAHDTPKHGFTPLAQTDFQRLEQAHYLKGLLKPFKGKGELFAWANDCEALRNGLIALAQGVLAQASAYPLGLLPVMLARQTTGTGTAFLRWRNNDRSTMGTSLWAKLVQAPSTPIPMVHELYALELQRIALNMQISLTHTLSRQARECGQKMDEAEAVYEQRIRATLPLRG